MLRTEIKELLIRALQETNLARFLPSSQVIVEAGREPEQGDYASNAALVVASRVDKRATELAEIIRTSLKYQLSQKPGFIEKIEVAPPGFINFYLSKDCRQKQIIEILRQREKYGNLAVGQGRKVQVEFISANPTGPLTLGNGRGGFWGDALSNVLKKAGFRVEKAYYINDYGQQILALGHSVLKDAEAKYKGEYIDSLAQKIRTKNPYRAGEQAARLIMAGIRKTVLRMGIKYDQWLSETSFHRSGRVDKVMARLKKLDLLYEKEGAWWFKSSVFNDQRDRVLVKSDKEKTYLAGDAALHQYKFEDKRFDKVIDIWGADHWGDVPGLLGVVEALGHKNKLEILIHQFVTLLEDGQEVRMSKREGKYVTMDELLDLVGKDSARFFFLQKSADTHLNFDLDLAKEQSERNPVFYVQYAHARICSIISKLENKSPDFAALAKNLKLLNHASEISLSKHLLRLPEIIEDTASDYQTQRLPQYALELATSFHRFYRDCRVLSWDERLSQARLALILAVKIVLKNTLDLMGISSPEKM